MSSNNTQPSQFGLQPSGFTDNSTFNANPIYALGNAWFDMGHQLQALADQLDQSYQQMASQWTGHGAEANGAAVAQIYNMLVPLPNACFLMGATLNNYASTALKAVEKEAKDIEIQDFVGLFGSLIGLILPFLFAGADLAFSALASLASRFLPALVVELATEFPMLEQLAQSVASLTDSDLSSEISSLSQDSDLTGNLTDTDVTTLADGAPHVGDVPTVDPAGDPVVSAPEPSAGPATEPPPTPEPGPLSAPEPGPLSAPDASPPPVPARAAAPDPEAGPGPEAGGPVSLSKLGQFVKSAVVDAAVGAGTNSAVNELSTVLADRRTGTPLSYNVKDANKSPFDALDVLGVPDPEAGAAAAGAGRGGDVTVPVGIGGRGADPGADIPVIPKVGVPDDVPVIPDITSNLSSHSVNTGNVSLSDHGSLSDGSVTLGSVDLGHDGGGVPVGGGHASDPVLPSGGDLGTPGPAGTQVREPGGTGGGHPDGEPPSVTSQTPQAVVSNRPGGNQANVFTFGQRSFGNGQELPPQAPRAEGPGFTFGTANGGGDGAPAVAVRHQGDAGGGSGQPEEAAAVEGSGAPAVDHELGGGVPDPGAVSHDPAGPVASPGGSHEVTNPGGSADAEHQSGQGNQGSQTGEGDPGDTELPADAKEFFQKLSEAGKGQPPGGGKDPFDGGNGKDPGAGGATTVLQVHDIAFDFHSEPAAFAGKAQTGPADGYPSLAKNDAAANAAAAKVWRLLNGETEPAPAYHDSAQDQVLPAPEAPPRYTPEDARAGGDGGLSVPKPEYMRPPGNRPVRDYPDETDHGSGSPDLTGNTHGDEDGGAHGPVNPLDERAARESAEQQQLKQSAAAEAEHDMMERIMSFNPHGAAYKGDGRPGDAGDGTSSNLGKANHGIDQTVRQRQAVLSELDRLTGPKGGTPSAEDTARVGQLHGQLEELNEREAALDAQRVFGDPRTADVTPGPADTKPQVVEELGKVAIARRRLLTQRATLPQDEFRGQMAEVNARETGLLRTQERLGQAADVAHPAQDQARAEAAATQVRQAGARFKVTVARHHDDGAQERLGQARRVESITHHNAAAGTGSKDDADRATGIRMQREAEAAHTTRALHDAQVELDQVEAQVARARAEASAHGEAAAWAARERAAADHATTVGSAAAARETRLATEAAYERAQTKLDHWEGKLAIRQVVARDSADRHDKAIDAVRSAEGNGPRIAHAERSKLQQAGKTLANADEAVRRAVILRDAAANEVGRTRAAMERARAADEALRQDVTRVQARLVTADHEYHAAARTASLDLARAIDAQRAVVDGTGAELARAREGLAQAEQVDAAAQAGQGNTALSAPLRELAEADVAVAIAAHQEAQAGLGHILAQAEHAGGLQAGHAQKVRTEAAADLEAANARHTATGRHLATAVAASDRATAEDRQHSAGSGLRDLDLATTRADLQLARSRLGQIIRRPGPSGRQGNRRHVRGIAQASAKAVEAEKRYRKAALLSDLAAGPAARSAARKAHADAVVADRRQDVAQATGSVAAAEQRYRAAAPVGRVVESDVELVEAAARLAGARADAAQVEETVTGKSAELTARTRQRGAAEATVTSAAAALGDLGVQVARLENSASAAESKAVERARSGPASESSSVEVRDYADTRRALDGARAAFNQTKADFAEARARMGDQPAGVLWRARDEVAQLETSASGKRATVGKREAQLRTLLRNRALGAQASHATAEAADEPGSRTAQTRRDVHEAHRAYLAAVRQWDGAAIGLALRLSRRGVTLPDFTREVARLVDAAGGDRQAVTGAAVVRAARSVPAPGRLVVDALASEVAYRILDPDYRGVLGGAGMREKDEASAIAIRWFYRWGGGTPGNLPRAQDRVALGRGVGLERTVNVYEVLRGLSATGSRTQASQVLLDAIGEVDLTVADRVRPRDVRGPGPSWRLPDREHSDFAALVGRVAEQHAGPGQVTADAVEAALGEAVLDQGVFPEDADTAVEWAAARLRIEPQAAGEEAEGPPALALRKFTPDVLEAAVHAHYLTEAHPVYGRRSTGSPAVRVGQVAVNVGQWLNNLANRGNNTSPRVLAALGEYGVQGNVTAEASDYPDLPYIRALDQYRGSRSQYPPLRAVEEVDDKRVKVGEYLYVRHRSGASTSWTLAEALGQRDLDLENARVYGRPAGAQALLAGVRTVVSETALTVPGRGQEQVAVRLPAEVAELTGGIRVHHVRWAAAQLLIGTGGGAASVAGVLVGLVRRVAGLLAGPGGAVGEAELEAAWRGVTVGGASMFATPRGVDEVARDAAELARVTRAQGLADQIQQAWLGLMQPEVARDVRTILAQSAARGGRQLVSARPAAWALARAREQAGPGAGAGEAAVALARLAEAAAAVPVTPLPIGPVLGEIAEDPLGVLTPGLSQPDAAVMVARAATLRMVSGALGRHPRLAQVRDSLGSHHELERLVVDVSGRGNLERLRPAELVSRAGRALAVLERVRSHVPAAIRDGVSWHHVWWALRHRQAGETGPDTLNAASAGMTAEQLNQAAAASAAEALAAVVSAAAPDDISQLAAWRALTGLAPELFLVSRSAQQVTRDVTDTVPGLRPERGDGEAQVQVGDDEDTDMTAGETTGVAQAHRRLVAAEEAAHAPGGSRSGPSANEELWAARAGLQHAVGDYETHVFASQDSGQLADQVNATLRSRWGEPPTVTPAEIDLLVSVHRTNDALQLATAVQQARIEQRLRRVSEPQETQTVDSPEVHEGQVPDAEMPDAEQAASAWWREMEAEQQRLEDSRQEIADEMERLTRWVAEPAPAPGAQPRRLLVVTATVERDVDVDDVGAQQQLSAYRDRVRDMVAARRRDVNPADREELDSLVPRGIVVTDDEHRGGPRLGIQRGFAFDVADLLRESGDAAGAVAHMERVLGGQLTPDTHLRLVVGPTGPVVSALVIAKAAADWFGRAVHVDTGLGNPVKICPSDP